MNRPGVYFFLGCVSVCLMACVPADQLPAGSVPGGVPSAAGGKGYPDLGAGATVVNGIHFSVKAYNDSDARQVMTTAENLYNKILNDTGLYNVMGQTMFKIVVYRDHDDYTAQTHQMSSSRIVLSSSTLYTYPGADLDAPMAHQMTHLIFESYVGEKASNFRWLDEGLAMFEELSKMSDADKAAFQSNQVNALRTNKMPFSQMTFYVPNNEDQRFTDSWYAQVESVVAFLISQGTSQNFAGLLNDLKQNLDIDRALANNYPQKFRSMNDLETAWKATVPS